MGLLDNIRSIFSGPKELSTKTNSYNPADWTTVGGIADGFNPRNPLLANREWVFVAVDRVANAVAGVRIKAMKYNGKTDDEEVFEGPLVDFLERPGANLTGKDFVYLTTVYKELTGNSFWRKEGKGRRGNLKLTPLVPFRVAPAIRNDQLIGYRYTTPNGQEIISLNEVLHDFYVNPLQPWWGAGKLQRIDRWIDTSAFANEFLRLFFLQGTSFGGFIETEEESHERIKLIKAGLHNDHVGINNSHKWAVLPKGSKATRTTSNMQEIQMGETDDRYRDKILAAFGVPKAILGIVEDVNRANAEASEYVFARYTIKPIVDDLIEFLNVKVVPIIDPSGKTYFDYEDFVPENKELKIKERGVALNRQPYKSVNEVRAEDGLPPVDGGDVIYGNPFQLPLGAPKAAPEPAAPDQEDNDKPVPTKMTQKRLPSHVRKAAVRKKRLKDIVDVLDILKDSVKDTESVSEDRAADEAAHKEFVGRVEPFIDRIASAVVVFNSEQRNRVLTNINRITKAVSKTDVFDMDEEVSLMVNVVEPLLRGLLTEQALAEYAAQGFAGVFDNGDEVLARIALTASTRLAKSYNNTTAALLKDALNNGLQAGESLSELTKRVQEVYEFSDVSRARAVANTEAFYIANKANQEAYRQSGVVKTQRWYTAEDELVCPHCQPMDGTVIDVDAIFFKKGDSMIGSDGKVLDLNYRDIDAPPLHTNCRCFIRPETIEIE